MTHFHFKVKHQVILTHYRKGDNVYTSNSLKNISQNH